jgi:transcriptional regulator with XRE-family HTH domain
MIDLMSRILDEIRKAIKASGKSRYRLSKDTSIPQSQLSRLMTGEKALSIESLEKLVNALGLEIIIKPKKAGKRQVKYGKRD